ncbi:MAG: endonuclease/exonuclease/phosphatase family protein [Planctomycetales bacterium]|nr:endonuclease/exonuclease/phosphatase family protein [Planctomycetales bacterium]
MKISIEPDIETKPTVISAKPTQSRAGERRNAAARGRLVKRLSWVNLIVVAAVTVLIKFLSEEWWVTTPVVYLPRSLFLIPSAALLILSCARSWRAVAINLVAAAVVAGPLMNLQYPFGGEAVAAANKERTLRIVSCNVQRFRPDFASVLEEISRMNPHVIALQDADVPSRLLKQYLQDWHVASEGEFLVASKYPVRFVDKCRPGAFLRTSVARFEIDTPAGTILLYDLHQMTPRRALTSLRPDSIITETGRDELETFLGQLADEAHETREFVESTRDRKPALIVGDFNMPSDSSLYRMSWSGLTNAFNTVGIGYGYTFPCQRQFQWPSGLPWMRIDHVLASEHWRIRRCWVGSSNGSDHRPIAAVVELR